MVGGDRQEIADPLGLGFRAKGNGRKPQAADDPNGTQKIEPVL